MERLSFIWGQPPQKEATWMSLSKMERNDICLPAMVCVAILGVHSSLSRRFLNYMEPDSTGSWILPPPSGTISRSGRWAEPWEGRARLLPELGSL